MHWFVAGSQYQLLIINYVYLFSSVLFHSINFSMISLPHYMKWVTMTSWLVHRISILVPGLVMM